MSIAGDRNGRVSRTGVDDDGLERLGDVLVGKQTKSPTDAGSFVLRADHDARKLSSDEQAFESAPKHATGSPVRFVGDGSPEHECPRR